MKKRDRSREELKLEVERLHAQLAEAEETLRAIRSGEVDALVVSGEKGEQVFTLKGAEQPYRILIEEMNEGAVMLTADDSILYCNSGFADMLKTPLEKLMGTGIAQYIAPADKAVFWELLRQGRERSSRGEITLLARDGTFVSAHLSFNTLQKDDARLVYLVATDLTEQKQIQHELRRARDELEMRVEERTAELAKSEQRWATTLASIGDAVIATDVEGRITFMNAVAEALTGWTLTEALTRPVTDIFNIINEYTRLEVDNPVSRVLKEGMVVGLANHTILVRKDRTEVPIDDSGAPIRGGDGKTMGVVLVFRDITERKRAEEETQRLSNVVQEEKDRLSVLINSINDEIWFADTQKRFTLANPSALQEFGFSSADGIDVEKLAESLEVYRPDGSPRPAEEAPPLRALNGEVVKNLEEIVRTPATGELRYRQVSASPVRDSSGNIIGSVSVVRDITENKQAEEALHESEQRWAITLASIGDAVISTDVEGRITFMNAEAEALTGWTLSEASIKPGTEVFNIIDGYTRREVDNPVTRVLQEGLIVGLANHTILVRKDGTEVPIDDSGAPIRDQDGKTMGVVLVFRDITERKLAEEALQKAHNELELRVQERTAELKEANKALVVSEASYRELTESIDDLFYAMDRDLRYTYWNKASEALTGILEKDAIGKSLYELFPDVKGTKMEQFYIEALKTQQPKRLESEYQLGDKKFIFELNAYPTKIGLSVIAKDITEKKKLESQLLRAQRMESIGTLAGGIAHDLNNMLTPMMMSVQILKGKLNDEQSQKLLTILEKNSQRGADLIKQVLSFARGVEGERIPLQAKHHISEIEKIAKETFPRNIEIRTDIQKDLFTISGDATQLHQIIMNLCVNARDAMPDGGILDITASNFFVDENYARMHTEAKVGSYISIAVSDTGIGIPPKIMDRIFEPFFTTKEFGKGTGLGLSTALAIVISHGGFINVYSEVGKGTTFRVYLPAIKTEMQHVEKAEIEMLVGHGELVLVVEDEDSIREITVSTLEAYGYNVLTAEDGAQAVAEYAQNKDKINVILMDMMMPVMDGHASIRAIRKINLGVKIIAASGLAEKDKLKNVADYTNAFLPKPYTAEKLLKTIHDVLSAK